jgi:FkbM family methyltransferase
MRLSTAEGAERVSQVGHNGFVQMNSNAIISHLNSLLLSRFLRWRVRKAPVGKTDLGQAALMEELRQRLIHIEQKADGISEQLNSIVEATPSQIAHSDQPFGNTTYAQFGEDLIIMNIFHMLGILQPSYVDIGAHHPFNISNTALLYERGSRGINVEANPNLMGEFQRYRSEDINLNVGVGPSKGCLNFYFIDDWSGRNTFSRGAAEAFVRENSRFRIQKIEPIEVVTLNEIITEHANGRFPDFLTLDIEGLDFEILHTTTFSVDRPVVICVEALSGNDTDNSQSLTNLLRARGYLPYVRTVGNVIFVHYMAARALGLAATPSDSPTGTFSV